MKKVEWTDDMSVGVELIDGQHRALFDRLNKLASAVERRQGEAEIAKTLGLLVDYTRLHFSAEEGFMQTHAYPGLEEHKVRHGEFRRMLTTIEQDLEEEGATKGLADSIRLFIAGWLVNHIQSVDRDFGAFVADKGIAIPGP